jgi:drug/metabolite transporter (DMT)-like permease
MIADTRAQRLLGYAAAIASGGFAGLLYAMNKQITGNVPPLSVTFIEAVVATVLLLPWYLLRFRGNLLPRRTPWAWLLAFGLTGLMLFCARTLAVSLTGPTTAALVTRFEIVLVVLYSAIFLRERPSPLGWVGSGALVLGMIAALDLRSAEAVVHLAGVLAALACATGIAVNAIIIRLHLGGVRDELIALGNVTTQSLLLPLVVLGAGEMGRVGQALGDPGQLWLLVLGGACIPGMLVTYYFAMKRIPMWSCRLLNLVTPVVALLLDHFWLHSRISTGQLMGLALVIGGATLVITSGVARRLAPMEEVA